jgi:hypothetical protein
MDKRHISPLSLTSALDGGGWLTPRPGHFTPEKETLYQFCRRICGSQGPSRRMQKFFLYFIRTCFFVFIFPHFAFCLYLQHTTQTFVPTAGFEAATPANERPQTLALDHSATEIGGIRSPDRSARSESVYQLSYPCLLFRGMRQN